MSAQRLAMQFNSIKWNMDTGEPTPMHTVWQSHRNDPFAVVCTLKYKDQSPIDWTFARSLLADIVENDEVNVLVGEGDVKGKIMFPDDGDEDNKVVEFAFRSPTGRVDFDVNYNGLRKFLACSRDMISDQEAEALFEDPSVGAELNSLLAN